jgi:hypothetical protein
MRVCPVTGRIHRTARELASELARIDALIGRMSAITDAYIELFETLPGGVPGTALSDAYYAANEALEGLERERAEVEANPRPLPAGAAETWKLIQQNID